MLEFEWPWLCLALALPLLVHALPARQPRAKGRALKVPNTRWFAHSVDSHSGVSPSPPHKRWYWLLAALGYIALVVAAMRPLWVGEPVAMPREGRALVVALDISGSMEAQDMVVGNRQASRIDVVKAVVGDFVERREGDREGSGGAREISWR